MKNSESRKKRNLRLGCILTACAAAFTVLGAGCSNWRDNINLPGGNGEKEDVNADKTQLYIGLGTNGISDWMKHEADSFEEAYKDVSFETGKKGVQVWFNFNEKFSNFSTLPLNYSNYQEKIIITESVPYSVIKTMALDLTDVVTSPLNVNPVTGATEGTETVSIEDKMFSQYREYYKHDGHYYAIPAQESTLGIVYDRDLFEELGLFFANDTTENAYGYECTNAYTGVKTTYRFVDGEWSEEDFSNGPDGKAGTYDDGMPATYEEFFALCDYMKSEFSVEPIRWAGKVQSYATDLMNSLAADYHGEEYLLKTRCEGEANDLISFDASGNMIVNEGAPAMQSMNINSQNGFNLTKQAGYYYALRFMETLIGSDYYDRDLCFNGTKDHLTTQSDYLLSKKNSKKDTIAMLIEGSWWQGEASGTFTDMKERYGDQWSAEGRNFGYMPLPKADASKVGEKQSTNMVIEMVTLVTKNVNANEQKLCELFLKHMYSRQGLLDFTQITGEMRPYTLDLTDAEYNGLTGFGRSNYDMHSKTDLMFMPCYSDVYLANYGLFYATSNYHWQSNIGSVPTELLRSGYTAKSIFEAVNSYWTQEKWDSYFKGICY